MIRMLMRGGAVVWVVLALVAATGLFLLKYEVQALEAELAGIEKANERHREAIHVLRAEWSYMNQPGRLQTLASDHLDLVPVSPERVTVIDALPFRPRMSADTDRTGPLVLAPRVLNPGEADAVPVPGRKPTIVADMGRR